MGVYEMRTFIICVLSTVFLYFHALERSLGTTNSDGGSEPLHVYKVNREVGDFPDKENFSTPEAAYAAINHVLAKGEQGAWRRISVKALADILPPVTAKQQEVSSEEARMWSNAKIIEVRVFRSRYAVVIAELSNEEQLPRFDHRAVHLEDGRWLNAGHSIYDNLDKARECARSWEKYADKFLRPRVDDAESYLKPFINFLKIKGEEPKNLILNALAKHKVVIMGEIHHRPRYWAFNSSLVTDPSFAKNVSTIYMELPSNNQKLADQFLASRECNTKLVIDVLRDNLWMGWPDQSMLDFFVTVWIINQDLTPEEKLRIVLVDMKRPWKEINKKEDWRRYNVDRNQFMADNIIRDLHQHPDEKRNTFFIIGVGHAGLNLKYFEGSPVRTTGWYLCQNLGVDNVYAVFQHQCRMTNIGRVDGRLCLGLFDTAFAAINNKPVAFPLDNGPFGSEVLDAFPDSPPMLSTYKDGFNAYLYLGPLETEFFSPLIANFYTDDFAKELDRRYRIMFKRSWAENYRQGKVDAETFINWMCGTGGSWGKPRKWRGKLGVLDAWKFGDIDEETIQEDKHKHALENPEIIRKVAKVFFEHIRTADYDYFLNPKNVDAHNRFITPQYTTLTDYPGWVRWICITFKANPIESIELGKVFKSEKASVWGGKPMIPAISYKLVLKDGTILEGTLPFAYHVKQQCWRGELGVDWHLQNKVIPKE
jgi:hypothetical protein